MNMSQRGDDGRPQVDRRRGAEQRGSRGRIDGPLAQMQAQVVEVLHETDAAAACEPGPDAVDKARRGERDRQEQKSIE